MRTVIANSAKAAGKGRCWRLSLQGTLEQPGKGRLHRSPSALLPAEAQRASPWSGKCAEPRIHPDTTGPRESAPWRPLGCLGPIGLKPGADSLFKIKSNKSSSDFRTNREGLWSLAHCTACHRLRMSLPIHLGLRWKPLFAGASESVVRSFLERLRLWHFLEEKYEVSSFACMILADDFEGLGETLCGGADTTPIFQMQKLSLREAKGYVLKATHKVSGTGSNSRVLILTTMTCFLLV